MLTNVDSIPPYPRQLLQVFLQSVINSPDINVPKKTKIEDLCQQIVGTWTAEEKHEEA